MGLVLGLADALNGSAAIFAGFAKSDHGPKIAVKIRLTTLPSETGS